MILKIRHLTRYRYPAAVSLGAQTLRLKPRVEPGQRLLDFSLRLSPQPQGLGENLELDGSHSQLAWFQGLHTAFEAEALSTVELERENPFAFVVSEPGFLTLPARYPGALEAALHPYLHRAHSSPAVDTLSRDVLQAVRGSSTAFLPALCLRLHGQLARVPRPEGPCLAPEATLSAGQGACRDLAWLFVDAARAAGLAARFVSGYAFTGLGSDLHELHAWAEAYLPGGGWRAFDPSTGLALGDSHVTLVAAYHPDLAAPLSGSFSGPGSAIMETEVDIAMQNP